ncbi:MAG TPA: ribbon-helix-helix protein, CopG family [Longimicrobiales bacterium]|nr:ribbon-helix-helix protein, CopG family [Longimicrobiales bacterium]
MSKKRHPPARVREPVQVYLDPADRDRLDRLREQLGSNKSDVLRKGLEALERELTDPERHPALRIIGIATGADWPPEEAGDAAREHDRILADAEEQAWRGGPGEPRRGA